MRFWVFLAALVLLLAGCGQAERPEQRQEGNAGVEEPADKSEAPNANENVKREAPEPTNGKDDADGPGRRQTRDPGKGEAKPDDGPAPGYNLVETPDGGLSAEMPPSWGAETGEDSEKDADSGSWSYHAGEYLTSSITTAKSLEDWYGGSGSSGAYLVASRALAAYSDDEITRSLLNATKGETCAEEGPYTDYERGPYSGKLQTWHGCGQDRATEYALAAAPEGRECVVALGARVSEEADREAVEHLVDTFEADCGAVASEPLPDAAASPSASAPDERDEPAEPSSASASSSASAGASASASARPPGVEGNPCGGFAPGSAEAEECYDELGIGPPATASPSADPCPDPDFPRETPDGCQASDLPDVRFGPEASPTATAPPGAGSSNPTAGASASPNP